MGLIGNLWEQLFGIGFRRGTKTFTKQVVKKGDIAQVDFAGFWRGRIKYSAVPYVRSQCPGGFHIIDKDDNAFDGYKRGDWDGNEVWRLKYVGGNPLTGEVQFIPRESLGVQSAWDSFWGDDDWGTVFKKMMGMAGKAFTVLPGHIWDIAWSDKNNAQFFKVPKCKEWGHHYGIQERLNEKMLSALTDDDNPYPGDPFASIYVPDHGGWYISTGKTISCLGLSTTNFQTFSHERMAPDDWAWWQEGIGDRYEEAFLEGSGFTGIGGVGSESYAKTRTKDSNDDGVIDKQDRGHDGLDPANVIDLHPMHIGVGSINNLLHDSTGVDILEWDFEAAKHNYDEINNEIVWVPFKVADAVANFQTNSFQEWGADTHVDGQHWSFYDGLPNGTGLDHSGEVVEDEAAVLWFWNFVWNTKDGTYHHWFDVSATSHYTGTRGNRNKHNRPFKGIRHFEADVLVNTRGEALKDKYILCEYIPNFDLGREEPYMYEYMPIQTIDGVNHAGFSHQALHFSLSSMTNVEDIKGLPGSWDNDDAETDTNWHDNLRMHSFIRFYAGDLKGGAICPGNKARDYRRGMKAHSSGVHKDAHMLPATGSLPEEDSREVDMPSQMRKSFVMSDTSSDPLTFGAFHTPEWKAFLNYFTSVYDEGVYKHTFHLKSPDGYDDVNSKIMIGYDWVSEANASYRFSDAEVSRNVLCWDRNEHEYDVYNTKRLEMLELNRRTPGTTPTHTLDIDEFDTDMILDAWDFRKLTHEPVQHTSQATEGVQNSTEPTPTSTQNAPVEYELLSARGYLTNTIEFDNLMSQHGRSISMFRFLNFDETPDQKMKLPSAMFSEIGDFGLYFRVYIPNTTESGTLLKFGESVDMTFTKVDETKRNIKINGTDMIDVPVDTWVRLYASFYADDTNKMCNIFADDFSSDEKNLGVIDFTSLVDYHLCTDFAGRFCDLSIIGGKLGMGGVVSMDFEYMKSWTPLYDRGCYTRYSFETECELTMDTARPIQYTSTDINPQSNNWLGSSRFIQRQYHQMSLYQTNMKKEDEWEFTEATPTPTETFNIDNETDY
jgi:hypothetical protein